MDNILPGWLENELDVLAAPPVPAGSPSRRVWDKRLQRLPEEQLARLTELGFVVLRPDSLARNLGAPILDWLNERSITPLTLRLLQLSPATIESLYRRKLHLFGGSVWLHHKQLTSGPSAVLLVKGKPGSYASLASRLDFLKGSSSPADSRGDEYLRTHFGRLSSFHGTIHCADRVATLLEESSLFFPWHQIVTHLELCATPSRISGAIWRPLLDVVTPPNSCVFLLAAALKRRVIAALRLNSALPDDQLHVHEERIIALRTELMSIASNDFAARRAVFIEFATKERAPLLRLLAYARTALLEDQGRQLQREAQETPAHFLEALAGARRSLELTTASWYLSGHDVWHADGAEQLFALLEQHDVPVLQEQRTLMQAALRADLNREALWEGRAIYPLSTTD